MVKENITKYLQPGYLVPVIVLSAGCFVAGMCVEKRKIKRYSPDDTQGVLHIDCADPSAPPSPYLQANVPFEDIATRPTVTFAVNVIR